VEAGASLQRVLSAASVGDVILLSNGTYTGSGDSVLDVAKDVTIRARSVGGAVLDGEGLRRVVRVRSGTVVLEGLVLAGGYTSNGGGLYVVSGRVELTSCTVRDNRAANGGGVFVSSGSAVKLASSSVHDNAADAGYDIDLFGTGIGGGMYLHGGTAVLDRTAIHSNTEFGSGPGGKTLVGFGRTATPAGTGPDLHTCCGAQVCTLLRGGGGGGGGGERAGGGPRSSPAGVPECPVPPPASPPQPPGPPPPLAPPRPLEASPLLPALLAPLLLLAAYLSGVGVRRALHALRGRGYSLARSPGSLLRVHEMEELNPAALASLAGEGEARGEDPRPSSRAAAAPARPPDEVDAGRLDRSVNGGKKCDG